jgi:nucleotide-binding universal stress UspA family protein
MRILIATDGSPFSEKAIRECCRFIGDIETAEILMVSAYEEAFIVTAEPFAMSAEYYQKVDDAVRAVAKTAAEDGKNLLLGLCPEANVKAEVLLGNPEQQIVEKARDWKADLIVVGSHGRGFWGRLIGSVSNDVVHHAPCSVLVVRTPREFVD